MQMMTVTVVQEFNDFDRMIICNFQKFDFKDLTEKFA
jgi:hypothetical protein